jgi:hypothetical protein
MPRTSFECLSGDPVDPFRPWIFPGLFGGRRRTQQIFSSSTQEALTLYARIAFYAEVN